MHYFGYFYLGVILYSFLALAVCLALRRRRLLSLRVAVLLIMYVALGFDFYLDMHLDVIALPIVIVHGIDTTILCFRPESRFRLPFEKTP